MKEIEINEIKQIELKLLKEFDYFCRSNNLSYFLFYGTLLGAIRHKGFIPWDDDVDVAMPREDYETFLKLAADNTYFSIIHSKMNKKYGELYAKIYDNTTVIQNKRDLFDFCDIGIYIDVFPIDNIGDTLPNAKKNLSKTSILRKILIAKNWNHFFKSKTHSAIYEPVRFVFFVLSRFFSKRKLIERIEKKKITKKSEYVACVCGEGEKEIFPREIFENMELVTFEGNEFFAMRDYDQYLKQTYGEYMKMPPVSERNPHHLFEAYYR